MAFVPILWMLLYGILFLLGFPFIRAIYYDMMKTHIPPRINQYAKIRFLSFFSCFLLGLAVVLEKVGLCHRMNMWRILTDGISPRTTSKLIIKDLSFDGVPVRVYWPKTSPAGNRRGLVYLSGAMNIVGSFKSSERFCRYLAHESDTVVVNVRYRFTLDHHFLSLMLNCCAATMHFLKNAKDYGVDPNRVVIAGDSSGGTLATLVCHRLVTNNDLPKLRAQSLFYPFLQTLDFSLPSYQQNQFVPPLFKKRAIKIIVRYLNEDIKDLDGIMKNAHVPEELRVKYRKWVHADHIPEEFKARGYVPLVPAPFSKELYEGMKLSFDPRFSPILAEDAILRRLPEMFMLTCEYDTIRDDALLYKKRLEDNGIPVSWHHLKDGIHSVFTTFDNWPFDLSSAQVGFQHTLRFLESL